MADSAFFVASAPRDLGVVRAQNAWVGVSAGSDNAPRLVNANPLFKGAP
ncbi:hypothetical protein LG047_02040 [Methylocystis sp. WRRC1]|nr:hypothetical protein [Methylocystis sp. WRRC1]MCC3244111.1 hypothetical protein [Methylocystis sp. WRRC1]